MPRPLGEAKEGQAAKRANAAARDFLPFLPLPLPALWPASKRVALVSAEGSSDTNTCATTATNYTLTT